MSWDKHEGLRTFVSSGAVDMNSPVRVGERVTLKKDDIEFEVEVTQTNGRDLQGLIRRIDPGPQYEAIGFKRGEHVSFDATHVHTVIRS